ncbi:COR domain-containing protein [Pseudanabaena sp. ABRG5-3]|uniref:COR domain-containing protein n=1 Tax=Pseudanabaena sp. ABRG5-3 TaxID=685565 RepID=UPI000DC6DF6E|nr:COR domain-containing protein [Pseudanabaena sp. ABRG5-3]BBC27036.1 leucine-rich repeat-containing protein [Pseudanabaena sp. ABRG5-3]
MSPSQILELIAKAAREGWEELYLVGEKIEVLPALIGNCKKLKILSLNSNSLSTIPETIIQLKNLQLLYLRNNCLNHIPEGITMLPNLKSLDLRNNIISEVPNYIERLNNLESLYLSYNSLKLISDSIGNLPNLQHLNLSHNYLSVMPESIGGLSNLQHLDLSENKLNEISKEIAKLPRLSNLALDRNPITKPPLEIVEKGIESIREYFKQIETEGIDYLYEAKLLIVGEGGAGKTTLANKIINSDYQLCEEDSTKGIEVLHWSFPRSDSNQFNVNIWDFGGQEIYHSTHQYFLTKRSLYLLVVDTRKEDTDFYYWLNVIELLSDNSPILIIKNEKQNRQREINVNQLRGEFGSFKAVFATNLATNRDLEKILTEAQHQLNQLPHIGQTLPKTWVKVRHALENDPRNYISLNEYLQICKDNGFKERKDALQLSGYLHDLGICLHFQDDEMSPLYQTVILKPKWGTDAAYAVLDNPEVIRNFGRFSNKELAQIWIADEYSGMHSGLLELMKRFQLCYEIPQCKGIYIAPQLLTENQPEYAWDESENLILRYTYDFMPKGLVRQFIVAMHESIEAQNVWRSGVIIHKREYANTRAEVIENYGKREIKIRVSGKNKRDLLTVVTHELDKIHNSYKRLADKYQKLIPCNCNTCGGSQNPHFYPFDTLQEFLSDRQLEIQCQKKPYKMVNVRGLLDDIGDTGENERQIPREKEWQNSNNDKNFIEFKPQINVQPQITIQQQQQQGSTMDNQQQQQSNSDNSQQQQQISQVQKPLSRQNVEAVSPILSQIINMVGIVSVLSVIGGIVAIIYDSKSPSEISMFSQKISTGHVGVAFVFIGIIGMIFSFRKLLNTLSNIANPKSNRPKKRKKPK